MCVCGGADISIGLTLEAAVWCVAVAYVNPQAESLNEG